MQEMQVQSLGGELVGIVVGICMYYTGGGNGNPLQYSCLGNLKDRGAWRATVHGVIKSQTQLNIQASLVAQTVKRLPAMWETWVRSLGWEDPLEKEMTTHSRILAWKTP